MRLEAPDFWQKHSSLFSKILLPAAKVYAFAGWIRRKKTAAYKSKIPVICIGNLMMGGVGKTPLAVSFAEFFKMNGKRPVFLTRGYGGGLSNVLVDLDVHTSKDVGDEALLLAKVAPTVVDFNRKRGAKYAERLGADLIIMDDGFQNPTLHKDYSVIVFDGRLGIGNGRVFPAGPLREPLQTGLKRAQAFLIVGKDKTNVRDKVECLFPDLPFFATHIEQDAQVISALENKKVVAFAGIGLPHKFFDMLKEYGVDVVDSKAFPDHYVYTDADLQALREYAAGMGAVLATTEKDAVRVPETHRKDLYAVPARMVWDTTAELMNTLYRFCREDENV